MKLAATADIIVENYRPGVTRKLGIDYEAIKADQPRHHLRARCPDSARPGRTARKAASTSSRRA